MHTIKIYLYMRHDCCHGYLSYHEPLKNVNIHSTAFFQRAIMNMFLFNAYGVHDIY